MSDRYDSSTKLNRALDTIAERDAEIARLKKHTGDGCLCDDCEHLRELAAALKLAWGDGGAVRKALAMVRERDRLVGVLDAMRPVVSAARAMVEAQGLWRDSMWKYGAGSLETGKARDHMEWKVEEFTAAVAEFNRTEGT
jgi:hypothetical protein